MSDERAFWLAWSQVAGIGPTLLLRMQRHFGTLETAWNARTAELAEVEGLGWHTANVAVEGRSRLDPESLLRQHEKENPNFWTPADADYPRLLLETPDPPSILYYRGQVKPLENQGIRVAIAIVGTRAPSDYGRRWTRRISGALAQAGFTVVSGLAEGVDTEAHHSCLGAGGRTIAVLGSGLDVIYPWSNRKLADQIAENGLLLSEYPAGTQPDRVHFPQRNRIIAGLSRAILVLEAPHKSGALITARVANDYGRDVYALPGSLDNSRCKGCLELLNDGAHMILGEKQLLTALGGLPDYAKMRSPQDQLLLFDDEPEPETAGLGEPINLEPRLKQVLQVITPVPTSFDLIVQQAGLDTGTVSSALSQLEIMGLVAQLPGMRYQKA
ncbi:MAG TPA: DNA-processing protein DprA [Crinalium sp.]